MPPYCSEKFGTRHMVHHRVGIFILKPSISSHISNKQVNTNTDHLKVFTIDKQKKLSMVFPCPSSLVRLSKVKACLPHSSEHLKPSIKNDHSFSKMIKKLMPKKFLQQLSRVGFFNLLLYNQVHTQHVHNSMLSNK